MTKRIWIAASAAALLALSGCMSGSVGVTNTNGGDSDTPSSSGASGSATVTHQSSGSSTSGNPVDVASAERTVYFEWTNLTGASEVMGLGFLSEGAQLAAPFEFVFQAQPSAVEATVSYWHPVLMNGSEEVVWIAQSASGNDDLRAMDPTTMQIQDLAVLKRAETYSLVSNPAGGSPEIAEIDSSGKLLAMDSSGTLASGMSGFSSQAHLSWIDASSVAVVDGESGDISIFSTSNLIKPVNHLKGSAFAGSPDGQTELVFSSGTSGQSGTFSRIDVASGKATPLNVSATTFEHARWDGGGHVAFVDNASAGPQVDVMSVTAGVLVAQYPVSAPSGGEGSICPAWVNGKLFFGGQDANGASVIWEADGTSTQTTEFAVSQDSSEGFQCPQGVSQ